MFLLLCIVSAISFIIFVLYKMTKSFSGKIKDISRNDWMKDKK